MIVMMSELDESNNSKESLYNVTKQWINKIVCKLPYGEKDNAYIIDNRTNNKILYIEADCDSLRHNATNYDQLLVRIKTQYKEELYKEAILNTVKYEATRQAVRKQHQWIHNVYKAKIKEIRDKDFNQQMANEIKKLEKIVAEREQELNEIRQQSKAIAVGAYQELQVKYKQLQKDLEKEKKRREELGKNNKSLGSYKAHYNRVKKENEALKAENIVLKAEVETLKTELKQWIGEN